MWRIQICLLSLLCVSEISTHILEIEGSGYALELAQFRAIRRNAGTAPPGNHHMCLPERLLNFSTAVVNHSNLGGFGPDDGEESLRFHDITRKNEQVIDLVVTATSEYKARDPAKNGLHGVSEGGLFGVINMQVNTLARLNFNFVDATSNEPVVMDPFYFSFFDIDQGMAHESYGSVVVEGYDDYFMSDATELLTFPLGDGIVSFNSTLRGGKVDNPAGPYALTQLQQDRTVSISFGQITHFSVTIAEQNYADEDQGRNILFGGASSLVCGRVHNCLDYECPDGYHIRTMAEFLVCGARQCEQRDRDICCYAE